MLLYISVTVSSEDPYVNKMHGNMNISISISISNDITNSDKYTNSNKYYY